MILKTLNSRKTGLSYFDLLGTDEMALSKGFAYLLSSNPHVCFEFLKLFAIKNLRVDSDFQNIEIGIENVRKEGRTDIEIRLPDYHIIIECKVRKNQVREQRTKYIPCFDKDKKNKFLCFITQERDNNIVKESDVIVKYLSWIDIINMFDERYFLSDEMTSNFLRFANRGFKMNNLKEILIQDLGWDEEIERFEKYHLYMRDERYGSPLYFAPYYTRRCGRIEGISYISKILGILTIRPSEVDTFEEDLKKFTDENKLRNLWEKGVLLKRNDNDAKHTYYFLEEPFAFKHPLLKAKGKHKGVGKHWISNKIPPNRCVSFADFLKHVPELLSDAK